jgi:hypothetical protein
MSAIALKSLTCSRAILLVCLSSLIVMPSGRADADDLSRCVMGAGILPLLGGTGDAPIIPVRINDRDAAMYISPGWGGIVVRNSEDFQFPDGRQEEKIFINGYHTEEVHRIVLDDLQIGGASSDHVAAIRLPGEATQSADGRPVVGVIGHEMFANTQILLDMPHGKMAFLTIRDGADCRDAAQHLMGKEARSVPIDDDNEIPMVIDGKERRAELDPDLNITALPSSWDDLPELAPAAVHKGELSVTHYDKFATAGRQMSLADFKIGGVQLQDNSVVIQRDIMKAMIGTPFFATRVVLFDYPNQRFYFESVKGDPRPEGHDLHFYGTIGAKASVSEKMGHVQ